MGDVDVVDGGEGLLHALGLVENEVVPKHHQNQQNSQLYSFHCLLFQR